VGVVGLREDRITEQRGLEGIDAALEGREIFH